MDNILYLDDYINLYNKKKNIIIIENPYKNTIKNGIMINREKFIKKYQEIMINNNFNNTFFNENITIITNKLYSKEDKNNIKDVLEELNYKNVYFVHELEYLNINKNVLYINYNKSYFYILYINKFGNSEINLYKNDDINKNLIKYILEKIKAKNIIIYGNNVKELENILKTQKIEYYVYEESENLLIKMLLQIKKV